MAEKTGIAWTHSTFNPWIGCTEVSPGCDHCYARQLDKRHRWGGATHWGAGVPRHRTANWAAPRAWNRKAAASGEPWRVFPSLCDPFDNEVPRAWMADLLELIRETPALTWLLLTKRIGNVGKIYPWPSLPNVWLGASVVNQEEWDRDGEKLRLAPAAIRFVSYEPALGPVDWGFVGGLGDPDWIIIGGESAQGAPARVFDLEWARSTMRQCKAAGVPVFVKQLGSRPQEIAYPVRVSETEKANWHADGWTSIHEGPKTHWRKYYRLHDRAGAAPAEWPDDLRVQEFPR